MQWLLMVVAAALAGIAIMYVAMQKIKKKRQKAAVRQMIAGNMTAVVQVTDEALHLQSCKMRLKF